MENKTFDKAALMLNEPEKIRVYRFGNTVYKVGNFFAKKNTETMKEILERTIRREAKSQVKTKSEVFAVSPYCRWIFEKRCGIMLGDTVKLLPTERSQK